MADSISRRNARARRRCDGLVVQVWGRAGRPVMRSPGRPPAGRLEHRQPCWGAIARGLSSEDAAVEVGVSAAVGLRWLREGGGLCDLIIGLESPAIAEAVTTLPEQLRRSLTWDKGTPPPKR